MNHRIIVWTGIAALLIMAPAVAQQPESKNSPAHLVGVVESGSVNPQDQQRQRKIYEDIEIMRRLLDRTLRSVPGVASTPGAGVAFVDYDGDGLVDLFVVSRQEDLNRPKPGVFEQAAARQVHEKVHSGSHGMFNAEGVYLPNQGVVYSATLPVHFWQPGKKTAAAVRKPLTDWERTRKELAGEKTEPAEKTSASSEVSLADRVLKLLFDNGKHFTQLDTKENLTVALTLRVDNAQCTACHQNPWKTSDVQSATERGLQWLKTQQSVEARTGQSPPDSNTAAAAAALVAAGAVPQDLKDGQEVAKAKAEAHKQVLLGDLHMKQGQPADAVKAYLKASQLHTDVAKLLSRREASPDLKSHLESMELSTKLAQALVAAGRGDDAQKVFEGLLASSALKAAVRESGSKPAEARPIIELPNKLIVSAPKALLDQAGTGKMTFDDFKKVASVQYVTFPTLKSEPPKPVSPPVRGKKQE